VAPKFVLALPVVVTLMEAQSPRFHSLLTHSQTIPSSSCLQSTVTLGKQRRSVSVSLFYPSNLFQVLQVIAKNYFFPISSSACGKVVSAAERWSLASS
jgi:hypothetical protein